MRTARATSGAAGLSGPALIRRSVAAKPLSCRSPSRGGLTIQATNGNTPTPTVSRPWTIAQRAGSPTGDAPPAAAAPAEPAAARPISRPWMATGAEAAGEAFSWTRTWYPVAAVEYLDPKAPNAVQLQGMKLVVWMDKDSKWRCFEDLCPHRLAPLSEGRIHESGELQCTYHGWRWDAKGACTAIPQIPDPKALATACASGRSCVKNYPTQVLQGMLWVYGDHTPAAWAAATGADKVPSSASSELVAEGWELKAPWFQRDAPLSLEILQENMFDPSHVPQSHHNVMGDRETDQRMTITQKTPMTKDGFSVDVKGPEGGMGDYSIEYHPPSLVKYNFPGVTMLLYAIPLAKGWSRVIMSFVGPVGSKQRRPLTPQLPAFVNFIIDKLIDPFPAIQHALNRNPIMDGDGVLMMVAGHTYFSRGGRDSWKQQYYMPGTADLAVMTWRKWLDRFGAALPVLPKGGDDVPPLVPREQVFDRYYQHTKNCPHCRAALRNTTVGATVLGAVAVAAVAAAAFAVAAAGALAVTAAGGTVVTALGTAAGGLKFAALKFAAAAVGVGAIAAALAAGLWKFREQYIAVDYVHATR